MELKSDCFTITELQNCYSLIHIINDHDELRIKLSLFCDSMIYSHTLRVLETLDECIMFIKNLDYEDLESIAYLLVRKINL